MNFGAHLKSLLESKGLTQAQLAELSGLSQQAVSKLVNGEGDPQWSTVAAFAKAMGVSTEDFRPPADRVADPASTRDKLVVVTVELGDDGGPMKEVAKVPVRVRRTAAPAPPAE